VGVLALLVGAVAGICSGTAGLAWAVGFAVCSAGRVVSRQTHPSY
jgi:hypothetical protein